MFRLLTLSLAAALVSLSSPAHAQVRTAFPAERGLSIADFPRLVPVGEGVYAYESHRKPGFRTVSKIVGGSEGVVIAEGQEEEGRQGGVEGAGVSVSGDLVGRRTMKKKKK